MNTENAKNNLDDMTEILTSLGLRYFLTDGTLLGAMREKNFIGHDSDIDLGVFAEEIDNVVRKRLVESLETQGFELYHEFGDFLINYQLTFRRSEINVDLFFYRPKKDRLTFHAFLNNQPITYAYPQSTIEPLSRVEFLGSEYNAPAQPEKLLEAKYGEWQEVVTEWDWAFSPKNRIHPNIHVITVGCFDLLHEGHINLFNKMAKEIGWSGYANRFFHVIMHDDYSIFQNKKRFPVQNAGHRRHNLEQLGIFPVVIDNKDPSDALRDLIAKIGEDCIFMRGDDWTDFPGKNTLEELGVKVKFVKYTEGVSTSLLRAKL